MSKIFQKNCIAAACLVGLPALLTACDFQPPLTLADKARFVSELIESAKDCANFSQRLQTPDNIQVIDAIYREAQQQGCIKRDI